MTDFKEAMRVFAYVSETTRSGLSGHVVSFFTEVMMPLIDAKYDEVADKYAEVYGTPKSKETLKKNYLDPLRQAGWIDEDEDPEDRRKKRFKVLHGPEKALEGFEREFTALFTPQRLDAWVEKTRRESTEASILFDGTKIDWMEFSYRYFNEWSS